jgi:hypothetical protein
MDILRLSFPFSFRIIAYADDLTVATSHKDPAMAARNLQLICDKIMALCIDNKMSLNVIKTILMLFSKKIPLGDLAELHITINGARIHPSSETQFLGSILDYRLKWAQHVAHKSVAAKMLSSLCENISALLGVSTSSDCCI